MKILFCNDDFDDRAVDQHFVTEHQAARAAGFSIGLIELNAVRRRNEEDAFHRLAVPPTVERAIYRGWMLTPDEYEFLHAALTRRNIVLLTTPEQYAHCHWLPNSYPLISGMTPASVWVPAPECCDMTVVMKAIKSFGGLPLIVKDYVKSRKHEWHEACFIPDASDATAVTRVVKRFLELQDDDLQGGLVFREFVELQPVGTHPKSGMPLTLEYRMFVFNGEVISVSPYWDADYVSDAPHLETFQPVISRIKSPFFSCDVARRTTGEWLIVELGDGQVAGLPEKCDATAFYCALAKGALLSRAF